mmetsp:Transcript_30082/g.77482  ORF Transcript_30082/g.77482 Transcript_30082/m.77482 type:complete len:236 (-) Transcript_30082:98-805(-)
MVAVCLISASCYYMMGMEPEPSGIGVSTVLQDDGGSRPQFFFWMRYLDWLLTTPLIIACICMVAELSISEILFAVGLDMLMVASGFVGAQYGPLMWPAFVISMFFFIWLMGYVGVTCFDHAGELVDTMPRRACRVQALYFLTLISWSLYPVLYVLTSSMMITRVMEVVGHAVLDFVSKGIFGVLLLRDETMLVPRPSALALQKRDEQQQIAQRMQQQGQYAPAPMTSGRVPMYVR